MPTLADYYIQIVPSAEGIGNELSNIMDSEAGAAGASASSSFGSKFSTGLLKANLGAQAITAATKATIDFGKQSVAAGMNFDSAMSQVAATMGTSVDEIQNLRDFAQQMGSTTAFSATEAAEALNYMALAGYDAQTSMDMLPNVLNLAAAGDISLASASDMVTDAQSALGLNLKETSVMVDQMAKASSKSNTSVAQLGEAILTIGATARGVKGGTQELSTLLGALADNGIKGAEGGTHLRNMLLSLQNPTDAASDTLKELGIAVYDSEGNMRSMIDIVGDLQAATADMDQQSKDAVVSGIFNKTDLASVNALLNTSTDRFNELSAAIDDSKGSAQAMADTQLDNLAGDVTLFKSALEGAQIAISDTLTPTLREFVQFGSDGLSKLTTAFSENGMTGAMGAFGEILGDLVGKLAEDLPAIVEAGANLIGSLAEGIIQNLPTLANAAMQIIQNLASGLAESLPTMIPMITEIIIQVATILIDNLPLIISAGTELFEGLVVGITNALPIIIQALPVLLESIITQLTKSAGIIAEAGVTLFTALVDALPEIIDAINEALPQIIDVIIDYYTGEGLAQTMQAYVTLMTSLMKALPQIITTLVSAIPQIISSLISAITGRSGDMKTAGTTLFKALGTGISSAAASVKTIISNLVKSMIETIRNTVSEFTAIGGDLLTGLWNGISDKVGWILDRIGSVGSSIIAKVNKVFGRSSPSKVFKAIGNDLAKGLEIGWEDGVKDANRRIGEDLNYKGNIDLGTTIDDSTMTKLDEVAAVARGQVVAASANNAASLDGLTFTISERIDLGDTQLKTIVSDYVIRQIGSDARALKIARGGHNVL